MSQKELNKASSYWDKRRLLRYSQNEKETKKYIKKIQRIYSRSNKEVQKMIDDVYRNYSINTGIDVQKLKTLLSKSQTEKTFKELKKQGLDKYVKENYKARISHLEQIEAQIYAKAKEIYPKEQLEQEMAYKGVINNNYYKTIYDIEQNTGFGYNFSRIDDNLINAVLSERWSGRNFSERIWVNTDILADSISEIVGSALITGQSVQKTAREVRDRFNVAKYYSERLVRTEMNYFDNQADMMAYEELGIEEYVLVATLDNKTSPYCIEIDGKHFPYSKIEVGTNYPPFHPNCRCTTRGYLGEDEKLLERVATNPENGERQIIPNMTYKEWYNKYAKNGLGSGKAILDNNTGYTQENHPKPKLLEQLDLKKNKINDILNKYEEQIKDSNIENAIVITKNGKVYQCFGNVNHVWPDIDLKKELNGAYVTHNHVISENRGLSEDDTKLFSDNKLNKLRAIDDKYIYEYDRKSKPSIKRFYDSDLIEDMSYFHAMSVDYSIDNNIGYKRWEYGKRRN